MNLFEYTYDLVRQIPAGQVSTYGAVARALGDIRAARAVGRMMNQNPDPDAMPCFKLVYSDGRLGGFGAGIDNKIRRLQHDGIMVNDDRICDFDSVFFDDFRTEYPLIQLQDEQQKMQQMICLEDDFKTPISVVGGLDVAYPKNEFDEVCVGYVGVAYDSLEIVEKRWVFANSVFPYIPGYLTYREFPVLNKIFDSIEQQPSVLLVDGNGILHPRGFGIACHLGMKWDIPTVGVAKKKLLGSVKNGVVTHNQKVMGRSLIAGRAKKPLYVSSGNRVSLKKGYKIVKHLCQYKHPEPLRQAHMLANQHLHERIKDF